MTKEEFKWPKNWYGYPYIRKFVGLPFKEQIAFAEKVIKILDLHTEHKDSHRESNFQSFKNHLHNLINYEQTFERLEKLYKKLYKKRNQEIPSEESKAHLLREKSYRFMHCFELEFTFCVNWRDFDKMEELKKPLIKELLDK